MGLTYRAAPSGEVEWEGAKGEGIRRRGAAKGGGARRPPTAAEGAGRRTAAMTVRDAAPRHAMARVQAEERVVVVVVVIGSGVGGRWF